MKNTDQDFRKPTPWGMLRFFSKRGTLCQSGNILGLPMEEGASIRDVSFGDSYSYTSLILLEPRPSGLDFWMALEDRLSFLSEKIRNIECDSKWIELFWGMMHDEAYSSIQILPGVLHAISETQCSLQMTCCHAMPMNSDK
jgi:hypothetical protein